MGALTMQRCAWPQCRHEADGDQAMVAHHLEVHRKVRGPGYQRIALTNLLRAMPRGLTVADVPPVLGFSTSRARDLFDDLVRTRVAVLVPASHPRRWTAAP